MKVLVTGGAGFIGSHTVDSFINNGFDVRILDNLRKPIHLNGKPSYLNPKVEFVIGDVTDKQALAYCLRDVDFVFHFAAYQDYLPDFSTFFHINAVSTALIYELIVEEKLPVKKVIVASSQAVMGEGKYCCENDGYFSPDIRLEEQLSKGKWDIQCPECGETAEYQISDESEINPQNQYAISKYSQEMIALNLGKRYNIPTVCMRYSIVQGPRQSFYNSYSGVMRIFSLALFQREKPMIFEEGNQVRDFVNIEDVVDANMLVLEKDEAKFQVFNVGGGQAITVNEFYEKVENIYNTGIEPIRDDYYRYGDTRHIVSDISKLKKLGWKPKRSVDDSILAYKEYLESQEEIPDTLTKSIEEMKRLRVIRKVESSLPRREV